MKKMLVLWIKNIELIMERIIKKILLKIVSLIFKIKKRKLKVFLCDLINLIMFFSLHNLKRNLRKLFVKRYEEREIKEIFFIFSILVLKGWVKKTKWKLKERINQGTNLIFMRKTFYLKKTQEIFRWEIFN
jgi:hypothetical protein